MALETLIKISQKYQAEEKLYSQIFYTARIENYKRNL